MKHLRMRLAALLLALTLLCGSAGAVNADGTTTTIDINTQFDMIMQFIDWYGIEGDNGAVLRNYFDEYFKEHPEQYVPIVNSILQSMDPYSHFMTKSDYDKTYGTISESFYGIGITFDSAYRITDVYSDGPAAKAGVKVGDVITNIDGKSVSGMDTSSAVTMLRGTEGSTVKLTVSRSGKSLSFTLTRAQTTPHHVYSHILSDGVAYVRVAAMGSDEDTADFVKIWNGLAKQHVRAAILDLRDNGGGLVNMAAKMIETVAPQKGAQYLGLRYSEHSGGLQEFTTPGGGIQLNKLIILTNGNTASAAEIVTGSLSDLGVATLLGEPTYGKGVGQYHISMGDYMLILTALEIQLPKRGAYNGHPIQPDLRLSLTNDKTATITLPALNTDQTLVPGMTGTAISAMTDRLRVLGYLEADSATFTTAVLDAVRAFQQDSSMLPGLAATSDTLKRLDAVAKTRAEQLSGMDNQLAAALAICKTAAAKPAQYTVNADGTFQNLT